jgi:hypothetical protein
LYWVKKKYENTYIFEKYAFFIDDVGAEDINIFL